MMTHSPSAPEGGPQNAIESAVEPVPLNTWWGRHRVPPDRADLWSIGPLDLLTERRENHWLFQWRYVWRNQELNSALRRLNVGTGFGSGFGTSFGSGSAGSRQTSSLVANQQVRSAFSRYLEAKPESLAVPSLNPNEDLIFSPLMPDHALILNARHPFTLAPGERLSTGFMIPLFLRVELAGSHTAGTSTLGRTVCELPLLPLTTTWVGPNPMQGEIALTSKQCLAIDQWKTYRPRLDAAALSVHILNQTSKEFTVERVAIPCEQLSLHHSPQTGFWCENLTLETRNGFNGITFITKIDRTMPKEAGSTNLVAKPRQVSEEPRSFRGLAEFRHLFGKEKP
ncbi:MAG: hypothetical protein RBT63_09090 [Bdellovibrionales bacterium]|jgi:hypothetical protein|nr:hypothetical protein [Bdellovibrionales bacterium]